MHIPCNRDESVFARVSHTHAAYYERMLNSSEGYAGRSMNNCCATHSTREIHFQVKCFSGNSGETAFRCEDGLIHDFFNVKLVLAFLLHHKF